MFNRFAKGARGVVTEAVDVAHELGATHVEAEHLLLAVTRHDDAAATVLHAHGLDPDALERALVAETERSLAAVGVTAGAPQFTRAADKPRFGTSAKVALEQAVKLAAERRDRQIGAGHVTLAVLRARRGTVPRALAIAGVDPDELATAVSASM